MDIAEKVNKKNRDEMHKRAKRTSDQNDWVKENIKKHEKDPNIFWKEMQEILPGKKKKSNIFNLTDRETGRKYQRKTWLTILMSFFLILVQTLQRK